MTNNELENFEKQLCEISALPIDKQPKKLQEWGETIGVNLIHTPRSVDQKSTIHMVQAAHSFLQTKMMLNACVSAKESGELAKQSCNLAKWSCIWAAVAAIAACISVIVMLFST